MRKSLLNPKTITSLQPTGKQTIFWDTHVKNFGIRVSAKGMKAWVLVYRFQQRQRILTLGHFPDVSLADARTLAEAARGDLAKGKDPAAAKDATRRASTFGELAREYLQKHAKPKTRKRTFKETDRILNREILPFLRHKKLNELKRWEIKHIVDSIAQRGAPAMANHTLRVVKAVLSFGINDDWLDLNPAAGVRFPAKDKPRDRFLSEDEIHTLWHALNNAPEVVASVLRVQLLTGQRISEVLTMRWEDLDLQKGWWTIPGERTKNGRPNQVPLSVPVLSILNPTPAEPAPTGSDERNGWVFTSLRSDLKCLSTSVVQHVVGRIRKLCKVEFRTHDLRRTVATSLAAAGILPTVIAKILNHTEVGVTARHYNWHNYDHEKQSALQQWGRTVEGIVRAERQTRKVIPFGNAG